MWKIQTDVCYSNSKFSARIFLLSFILCLSTIWISIFFLIHKFLPSCSFTSIHQPLILFNWYIALTFLYLDTHFLYRVFLSEERSLNKQNFHTAKINFTRKYLQTNNSHRITLSNRASIRFDLMKNSNRFEHLNRSNISIIQIHELYRFGVVIARTKFLQVHYEE